MNQPQPEPTPSPEEQLAERERAIKLLSFLPEVKTYTVHCTRTGVALATMQLLSQAGRLPYLSQWKESQAYHPLFSMSQNQLLAWTRKNWNYLFQSASDNVSPVQEQQFQIAFVAILHSLGSIQQDHPALPSFLTVSNNMQKLLELGYWYNFLESKRFRFPTLRVSRGNENTNFVNIDAYLDICTVVKEDYETNRVAKDEEAKFEAARRAEKAVRGSHVRAVSKRMLWNWFLASLAESGAKKYKLPEWIEWKESAEKLWFGSDNVQAQAELDEVDTIEDVFLSVCTIGTLVSNAFKNELNKIRVAIRNHKSTFEIDWLATIAGASSNIQRVDAQGTPVETIPECPEPGEEPRSQDFQSRFAFLRAQAGWKIATLQKAAWLVKYESSPEGIRQLPAVTPAEDEPAEPIDPLDHNPDIDDDEYPDSQFPENDDDNS